MTPENLEALLATFRDDIIGFAQVGLGLRLDEPQQIEMLRAVEKHNRLAVKGCRGARKTWTAAIVVLWYFYSRPGCTVQAASPTWWQLGHLWRAIETILSAAPIRRATPDLVVTRDEIKMPNIPAWRVVGVSGEMGVDRTEGAQGGGAGFCLVVDEAKGLTDAVLRSLLQPLAGHPDGKAFVVGTPGRPTGPFYQLFLDPNWEHITISAERIERLRPNYEREVAAHGVDDPFLRAQLRAEFSDAQEGDSVFDFEAIRRAAERGRIARDDVDVSPWQKMIYGGVQPQLGILGVDPAGRGKDKSIACFRRGPNVLGLYDVGGANEMETVGRIVALASRLRVQRVVIDTGGLGSAMEARLVEILERPDRLQTIEVHAFNSAWRADDGERYCNAKAEAAFRLRARFRDGKVSIPDDKILVAQLSGYGWQIDSRGRIRLIDPNPSPDRGDALLLAFADVGVSVRTVRARGL